MRIGIFGGTFDPAAGPATHAFDLGMTIVGAVGLLLLTFWKRKG